MSYELKKPITDRQKIDFIVEYNHNQGLRIEDTEMYLFALEPNEMMGEKEIEIEVIDPETGETHTETITIPYPVINPDYEQEQAEREKERIGNLQITKRVFALGLQQMGITYTQIKELIATNEQAQLEWDLCVELQRKNPLLDVMAAQLGVSSEQLDYIFRAANGDLSS